MRHAAWLLCAVACAQVDYQRDVHPVFAAKCFACHGGDKRSGGLSLRDYDSVLDGGRSGAAIVPQASTESLMLQRVAGEVKPAMPPAGPPLTPREIAVLRAWIDQGARPSPQGPVAKRRFVPSLQLQRPEGTLDSLLTAYLQRNGVRAEPVADAVYARRVYLDIWGFLPSPEQLREFTADTRADKRTRLVKQLLSHRENYAGHWITLWNDLLRNEDTFGTYGGDRKSISGWIERSLQENLPGNQFIGKLLHSTAKEDPEGFLIGVNWRGDSSASQMPWIQAAQNTAQIFLGINLKCNSCHDSFISRWTLKDAYGLAAFYSPEPEIELVRCDNKTGDFTTPHFLYPELDRAPGITLDQRHAAAAAMFLDPRNGRTPRTLVNRFWARLMGRGIVDPVDDMDAEPWSPEILDLLAADFVAHQWDFQWLIETIVTSRAYQLPSVASQPGRGYVFRGPLVRRLTAEQFIDSASSITGEWPILQRPNLREARYVREAHMTASPLSVALARPIRDQVVTERSSDATTLQMLELVNGPSLYQLLNRGARRMLAREPAAPRNLFDSLVMRGDTKPVAIDLNVSGLNELWLIVADQGSYFPNQVKSTWAAAELAGPAGVERLGDLHTGAISTLQYDLRGKNYSQFRAAVSVDRESHRSDINPAIRFFVFSEKPNYDRLVALAPQRPVPGPEGPLSTEQIIKRVFLQAFGREATATESRLARAALGSKPTTEALTDFLWSIAMTPEFQLIL